MVDLVEPLIFPDLWNRYDQRQASLEGWIIWPLSRYPGECGISAWFLSARFLSDLQACEHVQERIHQGSEFHSRAWRAWTKAYMNGIGSKDDG